MSVNDTNVNIIKKECYDLITELKTTEPEINQGIEYLEQKYNYLFKTSETLFKLIIKDSLQPNFNYNTFENKLNVMLDYILKIQNSNITQNEASEKIGVVVADEYIPKNLYKKDDLKRLYG
jgi:hypothetical protein